MNLYQHGWTEFFASKFQRVQNGDQEMIPARVVTQQGHLFLLFSQGEYIQAELSGKFCYQAQQKKDYPAVGDWVVVKIHEYGHAMIHHVLERKSYLARKLPISGGRKLYHGVIDGGLTEEQIIASNIDIVFIVMALDDNFNLRRLERYLTITYNSGASPVIILNKLDLCQNLEEILAQVESVAPAVPVHSVSAMEGKGMEIFDQYVTANQTVTFVGSSGVGKSSMVNYLLGEARLETKTVSSTSGKGRHTTTHRELVFHPNGGMIIDTPGVRELQLWGNEDSLEECFDDIRQWENQCKYSDCKHDTEPGCAIRQALEDGRLLPERYESYLKQLRELRRLEEKQKSLERRKNKRKRR